MLIQSIIGQMPIDRMELKGGCYPEELIRGKRKCDLLEEDSAPDGKIAISRWADEHATSRHEEVATPGNRCIVSVALRPTHLVIARKGKAIFDGRMPIGAVYVIAPGSTIGFHFRAPFDFLQLHIDACEFRRHRNSADSVDGDLGGMIVLRDAFAEKIARLLNGHQNEQDDVVVLRLGQALVAHVARLESPPRGTNALSKWRLKRVEECIRTNCHRGIDLAEMAKAAGLSRMHFAAQFRVATGYRPHEYLLHQRIERAKSLLVETNMALAEVAMSVGFSTQAHFSTVFRRFTDKTPARWRCNNRPGFTRIGAELQAIESSGALPIFGDCST
jgi:AraC family transcriptional regulator